MHLAGLSGLLVAPPSWAEVVRLCGLSCDRAAVEVLGLLSLSTPEVARLRLRPVSCSRDDLTCCNSAWSCLLSEAPFVSLHVQKALL